MSEADASIRTLVVDDEPMARASLRKLLSDDPSIEVVGECRNGFEAVAALREHRPDLMFLDIQMPGMTGFDVLDELAEDEVPVVVFATAYDKFALRAFEVHAVDYLLKPFDDERFHLALERAKGRLRAGDLEDMRGLLTGVLQTAREGESELQEGEPVTRLSIHREGRLDLIDVAEITWIEAADQYVRLHTAIGEHLMRETMSQLERRLDSARFMRIHRSAIVALDCVKRYEALGGGNARVLVDEGTWLPVSRSRAAAVRRRLS